MLLVPCLAYQAIQLRKELVAYGFDMPCLHYIKDGCVLVLESIGFDLQHIGIYLFFPKPFCAAVLNVFGVDLLDFFQISKESFPPEAGFDTKSNVGDSVLHFGDKVGGRQRVKILSITLSFIGEMTITALHRETIRQVVKLVNQLDDRLVNFISRKTTQD